MSNKITGTINEIKYYYANQWPIWDLEENTHNLAMLAQVGKMNVTKSQ